MTSIPYLWPAFKWQTLSDWTIFDGEGNVTDCARHSADVMLVAITFNGELDDEHLIVGNERFDARQFSGITSEGFAAACSLMACDLLHRKIDK